MENKYNDFLSSVYRCQTLLIVGDDSPHLDETVELNGKLDPEKTDFLKVIFIALLNHV